MCLACRLESSCNIYDFPSGCFVIQKKRAIFASDKNEQEVMPLEEAMQPEVAKKIIKKNSRT